MAFFDSTTQEMTSRPASASYGRAIVRILLVYLMVSSFLCTVALAQDLYEDKKNDPNNRPFYMGSRYGRSGQQTKVLVAPRTDRFFMGSRYGKRSFTPESGEEINPNELPLDEVSKGAVQNRLEAVMPEGENVKPALACAYLGVGNLYRCFHRDFNAVAPAR